MISFDFFYRSQFLQTFLGWLNLVGRLTNKQIKKNPASFLGAPAPDWMPVKILKKWWPKKNARALLSHNQSYAVIVSKSFSNSPRWSFYNILMYFLKRYYTLATANKKRHALIRNTSKKWQNWVILLNIIGYFFIEVIVITLNKTLWHLTTINSHCKTFFEFLMIFKKIDLNFSLWN